MIAPWRLTTALMMHFDLAEVQLAMSILTL